MEFNNNLFIANKKTRWLALAVLVLAFAALFFGVKYVVLARENQKLQEQINNNQQQKQVVDFLDLFVQKVLKTDKEVSFEDRLKLENAIRNINDPELLAKWEKFTGGNNESEIQQGVKDLLEALVKRII